MWISTLDSDPRGGLDPRGLDLDPDLEHLKTEEDRITFGILKDVKPYPTVGEEAYCV